jgi:hypothetical protein
MPVDADHIEGGGPVHDHDARGRAGESASPGSGERRRACFILDFSRSVRA